MFASADDDGTDIRTALFVEDDADLLRCFELLLAHPRLRIELASNGAEAIRKARRLRPDVVVLDVMMPIVDGFEVCRMIRGDRALGATPVIFLTGYATPESIGWAAGLAPYACFRKPMQPQELRASVLAAAGLDEDEAADADTPPSLRVIRGGRAPRTRVAVVDPEGAVAAALVEIAPRALGEEAEVVHIASGLAAAERLREVHPNVIVLASDLGDIHPANLVRLIRANPSLADTPLIQLGRGAPARAPDALEAALRDARPMLLAAAAPDYSWTGPRAA